MLDNAVGEAVNLDVDLSDLDLGILPPPRFFPSPGYASVKLKTDAAIYEYYTLIDSLSPC